MRAFVRVLIVMAALVACVLEGAAAGNPRLVHEIQTNKEFNALIKKHKEETGLPVIVDFYSESCGPCRQIAPIFRKMAEEFKGRAVFAKVDVNRNRETSGNQQIRSMPTFQFYMNGKKRHQFSGGDPNQLRRFTSDLAREAQTNDVMVTREALTAFYQKHDPEKASEANIDEVFKHYGVSGGPAHARMVKKFKEKYKDAPETTKRTTSGSTAKEEKPEKPKKAPKPASPKNEPKTANLELATMEELMEEVERRRELMAEEAEDAQLDAEDEKEAWKPDTEFPERLVIIGGGPAGLSSAIYASRAGLRPVVMAPPMGGQLQGKGVMVENYPGIIGDTGPGIVNRMSLQMQDFGAIWEQELVQSVNTSEYPFTITTNSTSFKTYAIIIATGADSRWLSVPGEYELRGGGVSSCATCDGFLYRDKVVAVIGGGDTAMEDALVLARTSAKVYLIHRRDAFRASKVLADRVKDHDRIEIMWNMEVTEFEGGTAVIGGEGGENQEEIQVLKKIHTKNTKTGEVGVIEASAAFVAIGHDPNTAMFKGILDMDVNGYIKTTAGSTRTSVEGIYAAGDVADHVYRQAVTSAGTGAMASLDAERWLSEKGIKDEKAEMMEDLMSELMHEFTVKNDGSTVSE